MCDFVLGTIVPTSEDTTPYAKACAAGKGSWRRMAEWVWYANVERVTHIALMRSSHDSARFSRVITLSLSACLGLVQASRAGWQIATTDVQPAGEGWFKLFASPAEPLNGNTFIAQSLWWNPAQFLLAGSIGTLECFLFILILCVLVRRGVKRAFIEPYRQEGRMTAGLQYAAAWSPTVILGALVLTLTPIAYLGEVSGWSWYPSQRGFLLSGGLLTFFGLTMWWYFLVRLAQAAPLRTRGRVVTFCVLGLPLLTGVLVAAWWYGLQYSLPKLFTLMKLSFEG